MKVLLQADVDSVGAAGQIINVSPGFARNFLLPRNLAVLADEKNVRVFQHLKKQTDEKVKKIRKSAEGVSEKLSALVITIPCKIGEEGKLFGSVTTMQIAEELKKLGHDIDKKKIQLDQPLKVMGLYDVKIKLQKQKQNSPSQH
jgi:large subunit ribosomal protein L9